MSNQNPEKNSRAGREHPKTLDKFKVWVYNRGVR